MNENKNNFTITISIVIAILSIALITIIFFSLQKKENFQNEVNIPLKDLEKNKNDIQPEKFLFSAKIRSKASKPPSDFMT